MLHTINKSPFQSKTFENSIRFIGSDDVVLFYEDGVLAVKSGTTMENTVSALLEKNTKIYALSSDLKARSIDSLVTGVNVVDYDGFVDLVESHKVNNWL